MAEWQGYVAIEDVALTLAQRQKIIAALNSLGPSSDPQPAHLLHRRVSSDASKVIFEALFNADHLTVVNVKQFVADAVEINPSIIDHRVVQTNYGTIVIYSVATIDRMRFLAFGGVATTTWEESRVACSDYLAIHIGEWQ